jgi:hypothetical protein
MPESNPEKAKRRKLQAGDVVYSPYKHPKKTPEGHRWVVAERHADKSYPLRWRLESIAAEPPTMDELTPKEEETGQIVGTTHAARSAEAMEEAEERREQNMREAMGLPPEDSNEESG